MSCPEVTGDRVGQHQEEPAPLEASPDGRCLVYGATRLTHRFSSDLDSLLEGHGWFGQEAWAPRLPGELFPGSAREA
jgi:hypothetical protein